MATPDVRPEFDVAPDADQRFSFIGGSEAFELMGERHFGRGCTRALAYRKLQTPEDVVPDHTKRRAISLRAILRRGHFLEDLAAQIYSETTGRELQRRKRLIRHPDHYGAGVHLDRIIIAGQDRPTGDLELKTAAEGPFLNMLRNGLPTAYTLQLQWSLFITGHAWGAMGVLGVFSELPFRHFDQERDLAWVEIFSRSVDNFWNALSKGELPPQLPDPSDVRCKICPFRFTCRGEMLDAQDYARLIAEREGKKALTPIFNDELDEALADRALIKGELDALDSEDEEEPGALQLVTRRIKELLGDQEAVVVNKHWKVYCSEHLWSGLDVSRLREEQPEIYKKYHVDRRPTGSRVLRVYALHDGKGA